MSSQWIFEGNGYSTEWGVRQAYLASMHKEIPDVDGNPFDFWKKFNVTYIENYKDPNPTSNWLENAERPCPRCQKVAEIKNKRDKIIQQIVVDVDGMPFNGDERSQQFICHTILAHSRKGVNPNEIKVQWVLANNKIETVTIKQLHEVLRRSVKTQMKIWINAQEDIIDI